MIEQVKRGHFRGRRGDCRRRHHRHCCGRRRVVTVDFRCMQAVLPVKRFGHESWMQPEGLWAFLLTIIFLHPWSLFFVVGPVLVRKRVAGGLSGVRSI